MSTEKRRTGEEKESFKREVATKAQRKEHARTHPARPLWSGFSLFGIVGWSVSIPTLLGIALGLWLDHNYAAAHSWTLTMLALGLALGCYNAWRWVSQEERSIHRNNSSAEDEDGDGDGDGD
jgi:ATP synthase protein I